MARVFIDGFETGVASPAYYSTAPGGNLGTIVQCPVIMDGKYSFYCANYFGCMLTLPSSLPTIYLSFKYRCYDSSNSKHILLFYDSAGTVIAALSRDTATGFLSFRRGGTTGTELGIGTTNVAINTTFTINIKYTPLNANGRFQLFINNEAAEIDITANVDTTDGLENVAKISWGYCSGGNTGCFYIDDIVVDDANQPGVTRIQSLEPVGNGVAAQWDPSTGSNYACVDEDPPSDADYVSTNTTDEIDIYDFRSVGGKVNEIKGVALHARIAKEGSPTPTKIQLGCRSGGANFFATDKTPTTSFAGAMKILETDPATSAAWSESGLNAAEFGIKATS